MWCSGLAGRPRQDNPNATWRTGLTQRKGRQTKRQVSPRGGATLAHASGKGKPAPVPRGARVHKNRSAQEPGVFTWGRRHD